MLAADSFCVVLLLLNSCCCCCCSLSLSLSPTRALSLTRVLSHSCARSHMRALSHMRARSHNAFPVNGVGLNFFQLATTTKVCVSHARMRAFQCAHPLRIVCVHASIRSFIFPFLFFLARWIHFPFLLSACFSCCHINHFMPRLALVATHAGE